MVPAHPALPGFPAHPALPGDTLRAVEVHYYRVPHERWELMLLRAVQSGANAVSTYIPWIHHAPAPDVLDLTGTTAPDRDLVGFVERCAALRLGFIAKPGPFCDSEMIGGGVPTWLLEAHPDWWAVRHDGRPYRHGDSDDPRLGYDHPEAVAAACAWIRSVCGALEQFAPVADRPGTLWAVQIDNESPGDGMWIHEDGSAPSPIRADLASVDRWRAFLAERYPTVAAMDAAWGTSHGSFDRVDFPGPWDAPTTPEALRPWLDLDRFADHQVAVGLSAYAAAVRDVLGDRVPLFHDFLCMPWPLAGMLVDPVVLADTCGWVGQNVYAEGVDPERMIAGTAWYRMDDDEYVHHAWWRTRLCHTLSPEGYPHLVPEVSARQAFYLQCSLVGGMDAPCIYVLHSSEPEPTGIGAFQRWAEEAPVLPDGNVLEWWWNLRCLFLCLTVGGADLAASPLEASVAVVADHAGERLARWSGVIPGAGWTDASTIAGLAEASNTSATGIRLARRLVDAGVAFDVVTAARDDLHRYELVIVPDTVVLSTAARDRLAALAAAHPGRVVLAGRTPTHDEDLQPLEPLDLPSLPDLDGLPGRRVTPGGVDVGVRTGPSGRRYVTVVNRTRDRVDLTVDGVQVAAGAAAVTWFAHDDGEVVAALLHGDDVAVGPLTSSQGQVAVARLDDGAAWHVLADERTWVGLPVAAGSQAVRVTLAGAVTDLGPLDDSGRLRFVHLDDGGRTDRVVVGPAAVARAAADEVAGVVTDYMLDALARVESDAAALGLTGAEVVDRIRRIRSARAAGTAGTEDLELLERLLPLAVRANDIRLGVS
jgi:beta-galactosidase GanA